MSEGLLPSLLTHVKLPPDFIFSGNELTVSIYCQAQQQQP